VIKIAPEIQKEIDYKIAVGILEEMFDNGIFNEEVFQGSVEDLKKLYKMH